VKICESKKASIAKSCALVGLHRSLYYYHHSKPSRETDQEFIQKIISLRKINRTIGAKKIARLLSTHKKPVNHKKIARILYENDLTVRRKRRNRSSQQYVERLPIPSSAKSVNEVWSIDFMKARKTNSFEFSLFNVIDIYSRRSPLMKIERSFTSCDVTNELDRACRENGKPLGIITDNGVEFTSSHFRIWCKRQGIVHYLTTKGRPADNAFVESFNSCVRRELLDENDFSNMNELRKRVKEWRNYYNALRPHGSLGFQAPDEYCKYDPN
jgi:putative transposase